MWTRRDFLKAAGAAAVSTGLSSCYATNPLKAAGSQKRPNIVLILTDDQGYGDVGFHGNKAIKTPNLDTLAAEGVDWRRFYVSPVCSPTRAGIMTGRYHYRTGVTNVGSCGDRIKNRELTLAELLRNAGYATAIYGKWHMGNNYPMRPQDNGFEEAIVHKGCCLTPWFRNDPPGENYFDPYLFHNGKKKQYKGYCMDVYTDIAMNFAEKNTRQNKPFFIYLSTNTPHTPLNVANKYSEPYRKKGGDSKTAQYYGTITNIDYNVGRLMSKLKKLGIDENTIVIFLSDNGAAGGSDSNWPLKLRGAKASMYEGGIRVPCVFRWPGVFQSGAEMDRIAAYIDLMPTLLKAAGVNLPEKVKLDGVNLMPLLCGQKNKGPERSIVIQWHQGLNPQIYRSFTVINQKYKLVQAVGGFQKSGKFLSEEYKYELFDISSDPLEQNDIASKHPEIVAQMKEKYRKWFLDVMNSRGPDPQMTYIGSKKENPVRLMASGSFVEQDEFPNFGTGEWPSRVVRDGKYEVKIVFHKGLESDGKLYFKFGDVNLTKDVKKGRTVEKITNVHLQEGCDWLAVFVRPEGKRVERIIPTYVDIKFKE